MVSRSWKACIFTLFVNCLISIGCKHGVDIDNNFDCRGITVTDSFGKIIGSDDKTDWQPRTQSTGGFPPPFSASPAFPNPAGKDSLRLAGEAPRLACAIHYALPHNFQRVKVTINDSVRTLFDGLASAGFYRIVWDLKDDYSQPVSDGCYSVLIKVTTDDTTYQSSGDIKIQR